MSLQKWLKDRFRRNSQSVSIIDQQQQIEESNDYENENLRDDEIIVVYLANDSPDQTIINLIRSIDNRNSQVSFYEIHSMKHILL
jgi:hypothetical protein